MRKVLMAFIVLACVICSLGAQRYTVLLESGKEHYIIDNKVNVRDAPALSAKRTDQLNAGKKILIQENTDVWFNPESDFYTPWYKITYEGKTGYVCGLYITHKETDADFDWDGENEIFGCVTVSKTKYTPLSEYRVSFNNWDVNHAMIKDGNPQRIVLSENPEEELSRSSSYEPGAVDLVSGDGPGGFIPLITVIQGFGDGGGAWSTSDYYYRSGAVWKKAFTTTTEEYECAFTKREQIRSYNKIYIDSVVKKWNSDAGDYEIAEESQRTYVWDGKTISQEK